MIESQLREIEDRAMVIRESDEDDEVKFRYAEMAATHDVPSLARELRKAWEADGGGGNLGIMLRNALKGRIMAAPGANDAKKSAVLAGDVKIHSLSLNSVRGQSTVWVDVRLAVGDKPVFEGEGGEQS